MRAPVWRWMTGALMVATAPVIAAGALAEWGLRRLETLDPVGEAPSGRHLSVDGLRIRYVTAGEDTVALPPVLLIHGFGGSIFSWRQNIDPLAAAGLRVIAVDLPGFGYSERTSRPVFSTTAQADVLAGLLSAVVGEEAGGARRVVVVGSSLGAATALRLAVDHPRWVAGLVLVAPALGIKAFWRRAPWLFHVPVFSRYLSRWLYYYLLARDRATQRFMRSAYGDQLDTVTVSDRTEMLRPMRVRGSADSALGLARSVDPRPILDLLDAVTVPVLIVAGSTDRAVPITWVHRLHERLAGSRLLVLDTGHLVQELEPGRFNDAVAGFVRELSGP